MFLMEYVLATLPLAIKLADYAPFPGSVTSS